jgi:hypothetical protein
MTDMQTELRHDDPEPQTIFEGREYEATIRFCVTAEATEDQIAEYIAFELGGGGIDNDHPMLRENLNRVDVDEVRSTGSQRFTDWGPLEADKRRHGRGRIERVPRASASGIPLTRSRT